MATPTISGSGLTPVETCPAEVQEILHAVSTGAEPTFEQGLILAMAEDAALEALVAVADQLRQQTVGDAITYVVNRNINFTNVCFRSEEHTSELQSLTNLVCRLLLEKKKILHVTY